MAKSLRSKWKRKMRAVKRERYGEKELKRLNDMLEKAGDIQFRPEIKEEDGDAMNVEPSANTSTSDVVNEVEIITPGAYTPLRMSKKTSGRRVDRRVRGKDRISRKQSIAEGNIDEEGAPEKMSIDGVERVFNKRTMRDQFGNYPDWMGKRKMRTQQKKNKRIVKRRAQSLKRK